MLDCAEKKENKSAFTTA